MLLVYKTLRMYTGKKIFRLVDGVRQKRSNNIDLICPQFRISLSRNSILCFAPNLFNILPLEKKTSLHVMNLLQFKRELKHYFL